MKKYFIEINKAAGGEHRERCVIVGIAMGITEDQLKVPSVAATANTTEKKAETPTGTTGNATEEKKPEAAAEEKKPEEATEEKKPEGEEAAA